ncbi:MAG: aspartate aminotransferase, partial [Lachnospiraceae bacterium]|nr:aspartate aminotransferase [Lachnospiraceae bacterium]
AYSPSKTFNLAGLIGSYHIIYNPYLRDRVNAYSASTHYNEMNIFSMYALMGAYTPEGSEWTDELRDVLWNNCRTVIEYMHSHFSGVRAAMPQGTYMIFLDCTEYCRNSGKTIGQVIRAGWDVGVCWQDGRAFGGAHHIRMNVALPLSKVEEALERIRKYVFV